MVKLPAELLLCVDPPFGGSQHLEWERWGDKPRQNIVYVSGE